MNELVLSLFKIFNSEIFRTFETKENATINEYPKFYILGVEYKCKFKESFNKTFNEYLDIIPQYQLNVIYETLYKSYMNPELKIELIKTWCKFDLMQLTPDELKVINDMFYDRYNLNTNKNEGYYKEFYTNNIQNRLNAIYEKNREEIDKIQFENFKQFLKDNVNG